MNLILLPLFLILIVQLSIKRKKSINNKSKCQLPHVPNYLHWDGNTIVNSFFHGEKLYWRRSLKEISNDNPFTTITLADISMNRSGKSGLLFSTAKDSLIDITKGLPAYYENCGVIELCVEKSNYHKIAKKTFIDPLTVDKNENQYIVEMYLVHDPLCCNSAHSMFRFKYDGQFVRFEDYKNSFGTDKPKSIKRLRSICKDELCKMIISRIVDFD